MAIIRARAKPYPEWTDITDCFTKPDGTIVSAGTGYKVLAKRAGCILRQKKKRTYVTLRPGLSQPIMPQEKQYITPPFGDV